MSEKKKPSKQQMQLKLEIPEVVERFSENSEKLIELLQEFKKEPEYCTIKQFPQYLPYPAPKTLSRWIFEDVKNELPWYGKKGGTIIIWLKEFRTWMREESMKDKGKFKWESQRGQ